MPPLYLALAFGGIALATAPAPALSIVQEFHTKGPVTRALLPMAVLDDIVAIGVFQHDFRGSADGADRMVPSDPRRLSARRHCGSRRTARFPSDSRRRSVHRDLYCGARVRQVLRRPAVWELDGPTITGPTISNRFMGFPPLPDIILSVFPNLSITQKDAIIRKKTKSYHSCIVPPSVKNTLRSGKCSGSKGAFSVSFQIEQGFQMVAV